MSTPSTLITRRIAADPTSTALLLAGPTAIELWPGTRRIGGAGRFALVETELPAAAGVTAATVRALPPHRTPTSYVTRFTFSGPGLPATEGTLTLGYTPGRTGTLATTATLELLCVPTIGSQLTQARLEALATGFLANLAATAEARSRAA